MTQKNTEESDPQTHAIIGAALEVHRVLGHGFLEAVYQEALAIELEEHLVPFEREKMLPITYKWATLSCTYRPDFVCFNDIIVEIKALNALTTVELAQVLNYLKATGLTRGLLLNFGASKLQVKRVILTR